MPLKSNLLVLGHYWSWFDGLCVGRGLRSRFCTGTAPANAPTIKQHQITPEALGKRLHGVSDPLPPNVVDAALAGSWFMPLAHPGMTGPYDIRGWHRAGRRLLSPARTQ
jgi:hypothetical protein